MDLDHMLERCRRDQWRLSDLDFGRPPRALSREDEIAIVQLFTDMSVIERLAAALFAEQERRTAPRDPRLSAIFTTFVADEVRHAEAAEALARHYDVHRYRAYRPNRALTRFFPHFLGAVRHLSDDVANAYITGGELILDIALLRSINDYVADEMSSQAMHLINRDESRHIAIDYYMIGYYASPEYQAGRRAAPAPPLPERLRAAWSFLNLLYYARPFFQGVFFAPMQRLDPRGQRLREAFKRMQLLRAKPGMAGTPFGRFMQVLQDLCNHPVLSPVVGRAAARLAGVDLAFMRRLYSDAEWERAAAMSFDGLAEEALAAKRSH